MAPVRILHLTHTDIRSDSRILKEMRSIADHMDCSVKGIGIERNDAANSDNDADGIELVSLSIRSRQLHWLPAFLRHVFTALEFYGKVILSSRRFSPAVVHSHDIDVLPLGFLVKLMTGARLIYDAHELESNRNGISRKMGRAILFTEKVLWRSIDRLIVVSPSIENWYEINLGKKPTAVILNSPVYKLLGPGENKTYLREKFSIPDDSKIFVYVGALVRGRGIELILEAFERPEVSASVVFIGYGELKDPLKRASANHDNIHVHDAVPHEMVVPIARSADFGLCLIQNVSLSDYYCLPNKLFEYCFAGLPVLASDFPDISEVVDRYGLGVCCAPDPGSIFSGIKLLEEGRVGSGIRNLEELSWQAQEKKLVELYSDLLLHKGVDAESADGKPEQVGD